MTNTLTRRQQNEAGIYNLRAEEFEAKLTDEELIVSTDVPPYPNREHTEFLDHLFSALGDPSGKRILEVGCGSGNLSTYLALRGADAVGVDVSTGMCALAERRARLNGVADNTTFIGQPVETLDEPDGSMDAIFANQVLHHLEIDEAMANIARLLKPGGKALFAEPVFLLPEGVRSLRYTKPVLKFFPSAADTPDERPLNAETIAQVTAHFAQVEITPFQATTRVQNFVHLPDKLFAVLQRFDRAVLDKVPVSSRIARYVTFVMSPPSNETEE